MPPLIGSPAINAAGTTDPGGTDQRGFPRFANGALDVGAVELETGPVAPSETLVVTTFEDEIDGSNSNLSLREAITNIADGGAINFGPSLDGQTLTLGSELVIEKSLTIDASALPNGIIIDGGGNKDFNQDAGETRCFFISDGDDTTFLDITFNNLTIQNGSSFGVNTEYGGNIHNRENLTLSHCQILYGRNVVIDGAHPKGGGIGSIGGDLTLSFCTVTHNQTSGSNATLTGAGGGAGIYQEFGRLTILHSTISDNQSSGGNCKGGGIFYAAGSLDIPLPLDISHSTISRNGVVGDDPRGGGILFSTLSQNSSAKIAYSTISHNQISGNTARGGAISQARGSLTLDYCTITENFASEDGGGVRSRGGNAATSTSLHLNSTIIASNYSGTGKSDLLLENFQNGTITASRENLLSSSFGEPLTSSTDNIAILSEPIALAPLGNYGGPTETMPPLIGSPAINAAGTTDPGGTDQRGFPRFVNGALDVGAVEYQGDVTELELAFFEDLDQDGTSVGVELAIGTNPLVADGGHDANLRFSGIDDNGFPTFTFGLDDAQQAEIVLQLVGSTNLAEFTTIVGSNSASDFPNPGADLIELTDDSNLSTEGEAFYRLEAQKRP